MADTTTGETLADTTVTTSTRADTAIGINNLKFVLMTIKIMSRLSFVASVGKFTLCTKQFSLFSTVTVTHVHERCFLCHEIVFLKNKNIVFSTGTLVPQSFFHVDE